MTRIFAFILAIFVASAAAAEGCFPFCDTGQWKPARCETLCNLEFWQGAKIDDIHEVLADGVVIDAHDGRGWEPIHYAVMFGTADMVVALLDAGADPNGHYNVNDVESPLLVVTNTDETQFAKELGENNIGAIGMYRVSFSRRFNTFKFSDGMGPVFTEAEFAKRAEIVAVLISAGADLNLVGEHGYTSVMNSVRYGNTRILKLLLEAGANASIVDEAGYAPLHYTSARNNGLELADLLVNAGVNLDATDADGNTALHWSIYKRNVPLTLALVDHGAAVDIANAHGETPLYILASAGPRNYRLADFLADYILRETEIGVALLEAGAKIDAVANNGETPMAALQDAGGASTDLAALFLEWGAVASPPELTEPQECRHFENQRIGGKWIEIYCPSTE